MLEMMLQDPPGALPRNMSSETGSSPRPPGGGARSQTQGQFLHDNKEREFLSVLASCQWG